MLELAVGEERQSQWQRGGNISVRMAIQWDNKNRSRCLFDPGFNTMSRPLVGIKLLLILTHIGHVLKQTTVISRRVVID